MTEPPVTYPTERTGPGRWCTVITPAAGVLWTDDTDATGFQPAPSTDPQPVTDMLATAYAAGRSATEAFDQLAALIGQRIVTGNLDTWRPDRNRPTRFR